MYPFIKQPIYRGCLCPSINNDRSSEPTFSPMLWRTSTRRLEVRKKVANLPVESGFTEKTWLVGGLEEVWMMISKGLAARSMVIITDGITF